MKREIKITGANMNLAIGRPAIVYAAGMMLRTSPVLAYNVSGGKVYIETKNSIYYS